MKDLVKAIEGLPKIVKLILAIPALDIVWAIYRIVKGVAYKNYVTLIAGILWIFPGIFLGWLLDIVAILIRGEVFFSKK